jgi:hypothetical protein
MSAELPPAVGPQAPNTNSPAFPAPTGERVGNGENPVKYPKALADALIYPKTERDAQASVESDILTREEADRYLENPDEEQTRRFLGLTRAVYIPPVGQPVPSAIQETMRDEGRKYLLEEYEKSAMQITLGDEDVEDRMQAVRGFVSLNQFRNLWNVKFVGADDREITMRALEDINTSLEHAASEGNREVVLLCVQAELPALDEEQQNKLTDLTLEFYDRSKRQSNEMQ